MKNMINTLHGFARLAATPDAWRCFRDAIKTARQSNLNHSGNPAIGFTGYAALAWVVVSFWKEDNSVWLVERCPENEWVFAGYMTDDTQVDYYTCVSTPSGVIPLPWVDQWFSLTENRWNPSQQVASESEYFPRFRSPRSQFRVGDSYPTRPR